MARAAIVLGIVAVLLSCFAVWFFQYGGQELLVPPPAPPSFAKLAPKPDEPSAALRAKLARPASLKVAGVPLSKVLTQLSDEHGIAIEPDAVNLAKEFDAEKLRATPISLDVGPVSLQSLLNLVLSQVDSELIAEPRGDHVEITIWFQTTPSTGTAFGQLSGVSYALPPDLEQLRVRKGPGDLNLPDHDLAGIIAEIWLKDPIRTISPVQSVERIPGGIYVLATAEHRTALDGLVAGLIQMSRAAETIREPIAIAPWSDENHRAILAAYSRPVGNLRATNVGELVEELRRVHHLPVAVDRRNLKDLGLDLQSPVELPSPETKLYRLFELAAFGKSKPIHLAMHYRDGTLWIRESADSRASTPRLVRLYDAREFEQMARSASDIIDVLRTRLQVHNRPDAPTILACGRVLVVGATLRDHAEFESALAELHGKNALLGSDRSEPAWRKAALALRKPLTVKLRDVPLRDALRQLGTLAGATIYLDRVALGEQGAPADELVSCDAIDEPLESIIANLSRHGALPLGIRDGILICPRLDYEECLARFELGSLVDEDNGLATREELLNAAMLICGDWTIGDDNFPEPSSPSAWLKGVSRPSLLAYGTPEDHFAIDALLRGLRASRDRPANKEPITIFRPNRKDAAELTGAWRQPLDVHYESVLFAEVIADLERRANVKIDRTSELDLALHNVSAEQVTFTAKQMPLVEIVTAICESRPLFAYGVGDRLILESPKDAEHFQETTHKPPLAADLTYFPLGISASFKPLHSLSRRHSGAGGNPPPATHADTLQQLCQETGLRGLPVGNGVLIFGGPVNQKRFAALRDEYVRVAEGGKTTEPRALWRSAGPRVEELAEKLDEPGEILPGDRSVVKVVVDLAKSHGVSLTFDPDAQTRLDDVNARQPPGVLHKLPLRDLLAHLLYSRGVVFESRDGLLRIALAETLSDAEPIARQPGSLYSADGHMNRPLPEWMSYPPLYHLHVAEYGDAVLAIGSADAQAELDQMLELDPQRRRPEPAARSEAERAIEAALAKPIDLDVGETNLAKFVELVAQRANINVILHDPIHPSRGEGLLESAPKDFKLTARAKDLPLKGALEKILGPAGLTTTVWRGALVVTPAPLDWRLTELRSYRTPAEWTISIPSANGKACRRGPDALCEAIYAAASEGELTASPSHWRHDETWIVAASAPTHARLRKLFDRIASAPAGTALHILGARYSAGEVVDQAGNPTAPPDAELVDADATPALLPSTTVCADLLSEADWTVAFDALASVEDDAELAFLLWRINERATAAGAEWNSERRWEQLLALAEKIDFAKSPRACAVLVDLLQFSPDEKPKIVQWMIRQLKKSSEPKRRRELILALGRFAPDSTAALAAELREEPLRGDGKRAREFAATEFRTVVAALARGGEKSAAAVPRLIEIALKENEHLDLQDECLFFAIAKIDAKRSQLEAALNAAQRQGTISADRADELRDAVVRHTPDMPNDWADPEANPAGGAPDPDADPADPFGPAPVSGRRIPPGPPLYVPAGRDPFAPAPAPPPAPGPRSPAPAPADPFAP